MIRKGVKNTLMTIVLIITWKAWQIHENLRQESLTLAEIWTAYLLHMNHTYHLCSSVLSLGTLH